MEKTSMNKKTLKETSIGIIERKLAWYTGYQMEKWDFIETICDSTYCNGAFQTVEESKEHMIAWWDEITALLKRHDENFPYYHPFGEERDFITQIVMYQIEELLKPIIEPLDEDFTLTQELAQELTNAVKGVKKTAKNYMLITVITDAVDDNICEPEFFETQEEAFDSMYQIFKETIGIKEEEVELHYPNLKKILAEGGTYYDGKNLQESEVVINKNRCRMEQENFWLHEMKIFKIG